MKKQIIERLTRYVKIDTQPNPDSKTTPSTNKQWDLLNLLEEELPIIGLKTDMDEHGYLFATLESNINYNVPTVGFSTCRHFTRFQCFHVNPHIIEAYNGQPIKLGESQRILDPDVFPELNKVVGHTLMVTDGTSLLGADDKAGVVEIMEGIKYLIDHPDIKHGTPE